MISRRDAEAQGMTENEEKALLQRGAFVWRASFRQTKIVSR
jgi:hypothetical protein